MDISKKQWRSTGGQCGQKSSVALSKLPKNHFQSVWHCRQQALRAYCPNNYIYYELGVSSVTSQCFLLPLLNFQIGVSRSILRQSPRSERSSMNRKKEPHLMLFPTSQMDSRDNVACFWDIHKVCLRLCPKTPWSYRYMKIEGGQSLKPRSSKFFPQHRPACLGHVATDVFQISHLCNEGF